MKKIYFSYFFFIIIFLIITNITLKFDTDLSIKSNINYKKCSDLDYKKSINLHPDKFRSIKLNLRILDYREWSQLLFEEEIQAKYCVLSNSLFDAINCARSILFIR